MRARLAMAAVAASTAAICISATGAVATGHPPVFTPYDQPSSDYTTGSCKAPIQERPIGDDVTEIPACGNIVNFLPINTMIHQRVPTTGWLAWGMPPVVERAKPDILTIDPYQDATVRIRRTTRIGGIELEPKDDAVATFTATFYDQELTTGCVGNVLGTITRTVQGDGGALLFGVYAKPGFRCIQITSADAVPYAIAEIRVASHLR